MAALLARLSLPRAAVPGLVSVFPPQPNNRRDKGEFATPKGHADFACLCVNKRVNYAVVFLFWNAMISHALHFNCNVLGLSSRCSMALVFSGKG